MASSALTGTANGYVTNADQEVIQWRIRNEKSSDREVGVAFAEWWLRSS
jgi:hypothetical protein